MVFMETKMFELEEAAAQTTLPIFAIAAAAAAFFAPHRCFTIDSFMCLQRLY